MTGFSLVRRRLPALFALTVTTAAAPAAAQPLVQLAQAREPDSSQAEWTLGVGYQLDFLLFPVGFVALAQTGSGIEFPDAGRRYPVRAYLAARMGFLPIPGVRLYAGGGGGISARIGGGTERQSVPSAIALAGFQTGRLHWELQFQRDLGDAPTHRWVTALGLSF